MSNGILTENHLIQRDVSPGELFSKKKISPLNVDSSHLKTRHEFCFSFRFIFGTRVNLIPYVHIFYVSSYDYLQMFVSEGRSTPTIPVPG